MQARFEDIMEAIELASDESEYYYNIETGEVILRFDPVVTGRVDEEIEAELEENWEIYIKLPTQYDINEYGIMEDFIEALSEERVQEKLATAIRGRGAFRRFKDMVYELGLEKKWYNFRDNSYKQIAMEWCKEHHIECI